MRGRLSLAEACVPLIFSALSYARAAAKEGEYALLPGGSGPQPCLLLALTRPPLCMLSPRSFSRQETEPDRPSLPPGLWHPLPISQSVHTDLLSATLGTDSQALGAATGERGSERHKAIRLFCGGQCGLHKAAMLGTRPGIQAVRALGEMGMGCQEENLNRGLA